MPVVVALVRALDGRTRCVDVDIDATSDRDGLDRALRDACARTDARLCPKGAVVRFSSRRSLLGRARGGSTHARAEVTATLIGGKGGFGTQLRTAARRGRQTTNFDACRDLSGRRLRAVNGERKIAEWEARKEEREKEIQAEKMASKQASVSGEARLRELEEKERESYQAERALVNESVNAAVASGIGKAIALEAAKRKMTRATTISMIQRCSFQKHRRPINEQESRAPRRRPERNAEPASTAPKTEEVQEEVELDLKLYSSSVELEALGLDRLKRELTRHGLKCGGTITQRAERLFLLRDKTRDELDKKLFAK
ncbi:splicing factor-like protein [Ostreococcus tauri]|uniref:Splicing factor-like protein n=1 Tax=Ostreococcus tauri TaxID=70448 RepID=A0A1Y5IAJ2_OSTTA|nr:splicing factor-like protein [Ostreococcus tauri]